MKAFVCLFAALYLLGQEAAADSHLHSIDSLLLNGSTEATVNVENVLVKRDNKKNKKKNKKTKTKPSSNKKPHEQQTWEEPEGESWEQEEPEGDSTSPVPSPSPVPVLGSPVVASVTSDLTVLLSAYQTRPSAASYKAYVDALNKLPLNDDDPI